MTAPTLYAAVMTPRMAPWGLSKSIRGVSTKHDTLINATKTKHTFKPGVNGLQTVQDGAVVTRGHLNAKSGRDKIQIQTPQISLCVPWRRVKLHEPIYLRLSSNSADVSLLTNHLRFG